MKKRKSLSSPEVPGGKKQSTILNAFARISAAVNVNQQAAKPPVGGKPSSSLIDLTNTVSSGCGAPGPSRSTAAAAPGGVGGPLRVTGGPSQQQHSQGGGGGLSFASASVMDLAGPRKAVSVSHVSDSYKARSMQASQGSLQKGGLDALDATTDDAATSAPQLCPEQVGKHAKQERQSGNQTLAYKNVTLFCFFMSLGPRILLPPCQPPIRRT